jgi:hypothetical protein
MGVASAEANACLAASAETVMLLPSMRAVRHPEPSYGGTTGPGVLADIPATPFLPQIVRDSLSSPTQNRSASEIARSTAASRRAKSAMSVTRRNNGCPLLVHHAAWVAIAGSGILVKSSRLGGSSFQLLP